MTRQLLLKVVLTLSVFFAAGGLSAQTTAQRTYVITGTAIDSTTQKGLEYATVAVTDTAMKIIAMNATDANGKFSIDVKQGGELIFNIESLGYQPYTKNIKLDGTPTKIDMGSVALSGSIAIKEVVVAAFKPLVRADVDKLIYSVEADPEAKTSTLLEILRKVPQLSVDGEDNVTLNGQSNYKVLVNGKNSSMYNNNFKDIIRSLPANSIKDIEVITNPSTKYESEGIGGIINIITNRRATSGYNGRIGANANDQGSLGTNAYIAAQVGKFNVSASYYINRIRNSDNIYESQRTNKLNPDLMYNNMSSKSTSKGMSQSLSLEASYEIDSLNLITLNTWGYIGSYKNEGISTTSIEDELHNIVQEFRNLSNSTNKYGGISGSLDYQRTFKKPDQTFTISYMLDNNPDKTTSDNSIEEILNYTPYSQRSWNKANGSEHTVQVDYYDPLSQKHHIEVGVKYILRINTSDSEINKLDINTGEWVQDDQRMNNLDYDQHIFGAYGGYLFKLQKFSLKTGFRAEGTINDGTSKMKDGSITFNNKMFNVVPYINLSYMLTQSQTVRLSYTQRLQRPWIWYLNPHVDDTDPLNIRYGNPKLDAVISNSFNANYQMFGPKWSFFMGANAAFANNSITYITTVRPDGVSESTYENIGKDQRYNVNASVQYRLGSRLNASISGNGYYTKLEAPTNDLHNEGFNYSVNGNVSVGLWKEAFFRASGGFSSPYISLQGKGSNWSYHSVGLSQSFLKKKIDVSLNISNPFKKYQSSSGTTGDDTFFQHFMSRQLTRRFSIYIGYRFGKMDTSVKKARRTISNDDRVGGSGGQSSGGGQ